MSKINRSDYTICGIPQSVNPVASATCRSRLLKAVGDLADEARLTNMDVRIYSQHKQEDANQKIDKETNQDNEISLEQRATRYIAVEPLWSLEQLIVPRSITDEIQLAINAMRLEKQVFDEWGYRKIEPFPHTALNFYGEPGTGKTLAAHGVASSLGAKILVVSYAEIESMYHGEGPKNINAVFFAAERDHAVLFMDEADSLLSKRLSSISHSSDQAVNSIRSQLLISLESYKGVVIFASNFIEAYDQAFETRVRHIGFLMPDTDGLMSIWRKHLPPQLPISEDVDVFMLAKASAEARFCGRDVKNASLSAALSAALEGKKKVCQNDLIKAVSKIRQAKDDIKLSRMPKISTLDNSDNLSKRIHSAIDNE